LILWEMARKNVLRVTFKYRTFQMKSISSIS
jgi:hypothetical protein